MQQKLKKKRVRIKDRAKPFKCDCGLSYQTNDSLQFHKKKKNHEKIQINFSKNKIKSPKRPGRPKRSTKEIKNKKFCIEEEEIWEKTLFLMFEFKEKRDEKMNIFLSTEEDFFDIGEVFALVKTKVSHPYTAFFYKELYEFQQSELIDHLWIFEFENAEENLMEVKLKKIALLCFKFADFLKKDFFEYFLFLNMEILENFSYNRQNDWNNCLQYYRKKINQQFLVEEILIFSRKYQENLIRFLNRE